MDQNSGDNGQGELDNLAVPPQSSSGFLHPDTPLHTHFGKLMIKLPGLLVEQNFRWELKLTSEPGVPIQFELIHSNLGQYQPMSHEIKGHPFYAPLFTGKWRFFNRYQYLQDLV